MSTVNRATSAYTLRVYTGQQPDLYATLDRLMVCLVEEEPAIDQHIEPGAGYVSVSYRARGDEAATQIATRTLSRLRRGDFTDQGATLTTGLGVHRRTVATSGRQQ